MSFQLYPYQKRVAKLWRNRRNIVLQAPTGAGKTIAALWPFLENFDKPREGFPNKCVYVVPMRVLAHQFVKEIREWCSKLALVNHPRITIQTGDAPEDPRFEGDLIFCTVDQFLSSYLTMPFSLRPSLANLNAGAMVGAYIVCDEFHLFDPGSTLPSALYVLRQLGKVAQITIMTATFSDSMLEALAKELNADVEKLPREETRFIDTRDGEVPPRQRRWHTSETPLTAQVVLDAHHTRSLALCNTVRSAQALYRELRDHAQTKERGIDVRLLHSRFLPEDRKETEEWMRARFGKKDDGSASLIVVATQTIEVGLDASCETLHTQLAPSSSLIQRAGRCARFPGQQGRVIVYPVESYMPYASDGDDDGANWKTEMQEAYAWISHHQNEIFDFEREQALVNAVATPRDERIVLGLSAGRARREAAIHDALTSNTGNTSLLVRDADSRLVLIHAHPKALLENPYAATGFSLQTNTLKGMVKEWLQRTAEVEWRVKALREKEDKTENNRPESEWVDVKTVGDAMTTRVLVVHPKLAGYLRDEGFVPDMSTNFASAIPAHDKKSAFEMGAYRLESYEDHIRRVLEAFKEIVVPELKQPAMMLEQAAGWQKGSVLNAAWLACLLHDVGKLSVEWQGWARAYQKAIGQEISREFAAAHTEFDKKNEAHQSAEKSIWAKNARPPHSGESAMACRKVIIQTLNCEPLARAVLTAITRHHAPFAADCTEFELDMPHAARHVRATLAFVPPEVTKILKLDLLLSKLTSVNQLGNLLSKTDDHFGWMAYTLMARALRRSDQEGTARGTQHI